MKSLERKKQEATVRDDRHATLSLAERIAKAKSRRGGSMKEIARLEASLEKAKQAVLENPAKREPKKKTK